MGMTALQGILAHFRDSARTEREKGMYFEELILAYFRHEPSQADWYSDIYPYAQWAQMKGEDGRDIGIDLVARTRKSKEYHAVQCKFYDENHRIQKSDIDSFLAASGQEPFSGRIIVSTTNNWGENAEATLVNQQIPVNKITLTDLEKSLIDWASFAPGEPVRLREKKELLPHQIEAVDAILSKLKVSDRGKVTMACGTGKTFTSLKVTEKLVGAGGRVLYLVPSLALLSQVLNEWTQESRIPLHSFAACSDVHIGKKRRTNDDRVETYLHELRYPATTDGRKLASELLARHDNEHISVVFSTYHSIDVIHAAQCYAAKLNGDPRFDLVICDEAHRTAGYTFEDESESNFVRVHDDAYIRANKRVYMTATPRIYGDDAKSTAESGKVALCSMDDESLYGESMYDLTFSDAVKQDLLTDYKVIVLSVDEAHISTQLQELLKSDDNDLKMSDAGKIIGCWKALSKKNLEDNSDDPEPMRRAVAFCQVIERSPTARFHKISSKHIAEMFNKVVSAYCDQDPQAEEGVVCEAKHVDGSMNASVKEEKLRWLREIPREGICRIVSNVRCLSEGVDVPTLDAVLFLSPRSSQIEVVQSVGRVMRKAPGKRRGYIILPVVVPTGVDPKVALDDNKTYKVVWEVLQALRSHDDRFDAMINKINMGGKDLKRMEVVTIGENGVPTGGGKGTGNGDSGGQISLPVEFTEIGQAIYAKIVQKCGNRKHWEEWAIDVARVAQAHITRIGTIIGNPKNTGEAEAFNLFLNKLRTDINDRISREEVIEMLAQHMVTKPVFEALFGSNDFVEQNPVSCALQDVLAVLHEHRIDKEADTLESFYDSIRQRAKGITNSEGRQRIILELYDKFFASAFPSTADRLGIVYTPVPIVDFVLRSVDALSKREFSQTLGSIGVHVLDPFTGTGTFLTRLLAGDYISNHDLVEKYTQNIHANEIVLLAYYIAAINIETVFQGRYGNYRLFPGILLTDTFHMRESDIADVAIRQNHERRILQNEAEIEIIVGNPPYSIGQSSANDDNKNTKYDELDRAIEITYAKKADATNLRALYDSYIRAFRWASDRIKSRGIIGFVTNASFLDGVSTAGMRKCLAEEFSSIYVIHLRGNARTKGERRRREGGNVFGGGSRTPVAITFLIKNPSATGECEIKSFDIGDYLTSNEKLVKLNGLSDVNGILGWEKISPDEHGDWFNQRNNGFGAHFILGAKGKSEAATIFSTYANGGITSRDAWAINSSRTVLAANMNKMIGVYNEHVNKACRSHEVDNNPARISWSRGLKRHLKNKRAGNFSEDAIVPILYRPFNKQWLYFDGMFNEAVSNIKNFFPSGESTNKVIAISGKGAESFSTIMSDSIPEFSVGALFFPLYHYSHPSNRRTQKSSANTGEMNLDDSNLIERSHAISDNALFRFRESCRDTEICKDDMFYFVYAVLHSKEYLALYASNLVREHPRIPIPRDRSIFRGFSEAGRHLADLHVNYDRVSMYAGVSIMFRGEKTSIEDIDPKACRIEKARFQKQRGVLDGSILRYNNSISIRGIPDEAYGYSIFEKSALNWVIDRQQVKVDSRSKITNDANKWAEEAMGNSRYPLELVLRIITVSLETQTIVSNLPELGLN